MLASCVPRLPPGPAPLPAPAGGGDDAPTLLPLVRQRVLEAQVLAARGDLVAARARLERAKGLWPEGGPLLDAEADAWPPLDEERDEVPAVLQPGPPRSALESALFDDDPATLRRLASALHTPAGLAQSPALVLLTELRLAVRDPDSGRLGCLVQAAAALDDTPRLARAAERVPPEDRGCPRGARGEAPETDGYPGGNSTGAPVLGVPEAVAPAWAAHRAGRPREARLLVDRAYRESGRSEDVLVWVRLIQGVPGEAVLWGGA
jgi:hypothetical protein